MTDTPLPAELLKTAIGKIKVDVDRELALFFDHKIAEAGRVDPQYRKLMLETKKLILRGGKRLRPFMVWLGWRLAGGTKYDDFLKLAVAWEIYHNSALILDDIMDQDHTRHNGLNIYGVYEKSLKRSHAPEVATTHARNAALMSGISTLMLAVESLRTIRLEPDHAKTLENEFLKMHFRLVGGQFVEDQAALQKVIKPSQIRKIYLNKSGYYSMVSPLQSGARLAGTNEAILDVLKQYGEHAGVAYQIIDDVIGTFGSSREIGKSNTTDVEEDKHTLLMHYGLEFADDTQKAILKKYLGQPNLTGAELKQVRKVLTDNGAKAKTMFVAQAEAEAAKKAFKKLALAGDVPILFDALTDYLVKRSV
jgi:geranylgeranyl diphosphate synthase type I